MRIRYIRREKEYRQFLRKLGQYLDVYMRVAGATQTEIAERAGLSPSAIAMLVHQQRKAVLISTMWNILDVTQ